MIVRPVRFALLGGSRISKMPLSRSRKLRPCGPFCRAWITALASRTARACPAACGARRPRRAGSRFPFLTRPGRKDPSAHKRKMAHADPHIRRTRARVRGARDELLGRRRSIATCPARLTRLGGALTLREVRLALSDLDDITVRIADVAARLAVLVLRLRDERGSSTSP